MDDRHHEKCQAGYLPPTQGQLSTPPIVDDGELTYQGQPVYTVSMTAAAVRKLAAASTKADAKLRHQYPRAFVEDVVASCTGSISTVGGGNLLILPVVHGDDGTAWLSNVYDWRLETIEGQPRLTARWKL